MRRRSRFAFAFLQYLLQPLPIRVARIAGCKFSPEPLSRPIHCGRN